MAKELKANKCGTCGRLPVIVKQGGAGVDTVFCSNKACIQFNKHYLDIAEWNARQALTPCEHKNTFTYRIDALLVDVEMCSHCGMSRAVYEQESTGWVENFDGAFEYIKQLREHRISGDSDKADECYKILKVMQTHLKVNHSEGFETLDEIIKKYSK